MRHLRVRTRSNRPKSKWSWILAAAMLASGVQLSIAVSASAAETRRTEAEAEGAPQDAEAGFASPPAAASVPPSISAAPEARSARDAIGVPSREARLPDVAAAHPDSAGAGGRSGRALDAAPGRRPRAPRSNLLSHNVDRFGQPDSTLDIDLDYGSLPGRLADPDLHDLWEQGAQAEREGRLIESAQVYELIVGHVPEESFTYWRIARNYWRAGEGLPAEDKLGRIEHFELAESWAGRGISIDPSCAPCMLWKFVAMGRQATTRGIMSAVRDVREMDELLTRGIELQPTHRDGEGNSTLGNLYYAGAVFYRVIPDWWWVRLFIGVRGDKDRSLRYALRAVEISEARVDYRVELGAVLLCLGTDRGEPERIEQGLTVLQQARALDDFLNTDSIDKEHATTLMASPEIACGYSRDGFIDVNSLKDEARAPR